MNLTGLIVHLSTSKSISKPTQPFFYGVIEGFYGRQWSWQQRLDYAQFLKDHGFSVYVYAPKGDALLRNQWRKLYPEHEWQQLSVLASRYQQLGVGWGVGLSPLGLAQAYSEDDRRALQSKVQQLNQLSPDVLCILFDDVRGDIDGLAARQLQITADIVAVSDASRHIVCPTYYSFDPVLEQVFGTMPTNYLHDLGVGLDSAVDIFWTGNQVISDAFAQSDLHPVAQLLGRKPLLWDNYPVNDGRVTSDYLHLQPFTGRPHQLREWCAGHLVNPMNQPALSKLVLPSLQAIYQQKSAYNPAAAKQQALASLGNEGLAKQLSADYGLFQQQGLSLIDRTSREALIATYKAFKHDVADEIVDWLQGDYQFDPDCLTG